MYNTAYIVCGPLPSPREEHVLTSLSMTLLTFWVPLLAPLAFSLVPPIFELLLNVRDSTIWQSVDQEAGKAPKEVRDGYASNLKNDCSFFMGTACRSLIAACLTVDAWAYSLLPGGSNIELASQTIFVGVSIHFIFLLAATTFTASYVAGPPGPRRLAATILLTLFAVLLAALIRHMVG